MRLARMFVITLIGWTGHAAELPALTQAMRLAGDAATATSANNHADAVTKLEEAVAIRPDIPRLLTNLAAAQVAAGQTAEAVATLERLAALGVSSPVDQTDEFEPLRADPAFQSLVKKFTANNRPIGRGEMAFSLREVSGLFEGIAWREKTGEFYFGDVNGRAVWVRNKEGVLRRLTADADEILGVFGLAIDESSGAIWAATSAVSAMRGYPSDMQGQAALLEIDLESGAVRRSFPVSAKPESEPRHQLGHLAIASGGGIYVTDGGDPVLWRLPAGGDVLERGVEHPEFMSLQGIVLLREGIAVVADRLNGLLRVHVNDGSVTRIESPADATLLGLHGLILAPTGHVIAIQNGIHPNRVIRLTLDGTAERVTDVTILEAGHLTMAAPAQATLGAAGELFFIGNAGWGRFEDTGGEPTAPRAVPVFKTSLGTGGSR